MGISHKNCLVRFGTFLSHEGRIICEITGRRKYGKGLEVPCRYNFTGSEKNVKKMKELLAAKKAKSTVLVPFL